MCCFRYINDQQVCNCKCCYPASNTVSIIFNVILLLSSACQNQSSFCSRLHAKINLALLDSASFPALVEKVKRKRSVFMQLCLNKFWDLGDLLPLSYYFCSIYIYRDALRSESSIWAICKILGRKTEGIED